MLELKYPRDSEKTQSLGDHESEAAHFRTPELVDSGAGGWCGFANDERSESDIVQTLCTDAAGDNVVASCIGPKSGSIRFVKKLPRLQNTDRYIVLQSSTDYWLHTMSLGASLPVIVKLQGRG